jgi:hypothetical protein
MTDNDKSWLLQTPAENWKDIEPLFVALSKAMTAAYVGGIEKQSEVAHSFWEDTGKNTMEKIKDPLINFLSYAFGIDHDTALQWYEGLDMPWPLNWLMTGITLLTTLGTRAMRASDVFLEKDMQALLSQTRHSLPDPGTLIRAAFIDSGRTGDVRNSLAKYGYSEDQIDNMFIANYQLYDIETIRIAWLRGIIDDSMVFERMREQGFTDTRTKEIMQTWPILPGPQDLFWMVGKEAFEPETYTRLGLDQEFPEEQLDWLKQQGISEGWAHKYWMAHWDQPSIQQGYEMLHRGVIDLEELDILFKTVEIPPYWRDKLTKIAYAPYTRVDVRRMHNLGILDDEQLIKSYKDLGYDQEHAENMALFTIRYNQEGDKEVTKGEILKGYRKKALTFEDAKDLLRTVDIPEAYAEYLLVFEDYLEEQELEDLALKNIEDQYKNNLIEKNDVIARLGEMSLPSTRIDLLLEKWDIDKYENRKIPSKTDMVKFLAAGVISEDEYREEMYRLGYSWKYVTWYAGLAQSQGKTKTKASTT